MPDSTTADILDVPPVVRRPRFSRRISSVLADLPGMVPGERISFGDLVDAFDSRAFGPLIVLFAAPNILPVALPGISAVLGAPLMLLTGQMMLGRHRPWLPGFLRRRSVRRQDFEGLVTRIVPRLQKMEAWIRPRYLHLTTPLAKRLIGALGLMLAIIIFLPVPFGNMLPGMALVLMAVGILGRDGLAVLAGTGVAAAGLIVVSGFIYAAAIAGVALMRGVFGV